MLVESVYADVLGALRRLRWSEYLEVENVIGFVCDLYCLVRGVKNRESLLRLKKYLLNSVNSRGKAMKLKHVIYTTIHGLV